MAIVNADRATTPISWPLYSLACVSRHLQLRTGGFVGAKFHCPHALAVGNQCIRIMEKTLEFQQCCLCTSTVLSLYLIVNADNMLRISVNVACFQPLLKS